MLPSDLSGQLRGGWSTGVHDDEDDGQNGTGSNTLGLGRVAATVLAHLEAHISGEGLHLLSTKLVVAKTTKGNGVTEELQGSDGVVEDHHGSADQQDILQDTSHGQDDGRSLANLQSVLVPASIIN